jgi:hypothetical protein
MNVIFTREEIEEAKSTLNLLMSNLWLYSGDVPPISRKVWDYLMGNGYLKSTVHGSLDAPKHAVCLIVYATQKAKKAFNPISGSEESC